jgi:hypothetical protein
MPHLPDHQSDHDPLLIAAFAAGDAEGADLERAQALVATCDECAALHHDLRAIASAMPATPAPARRRDFRLTPEQAAELRPSGWRRLLAPLAGPRFAFAGPLGGSLAALGLAGILVVGAASTPIAGNGTGAVRDDSAGAVAGAAGTESGEPVPERLSTVGSEQPSSDTAYLAAPLAPSPAAGVVAPGAGVGDAAGVAPAASQGTSSAPQAAAPIGKEDVASAPPEAGPVDASTVQSPASSGPPPVVQVVSAVLLLAGLALLALALVRRGMGRAPG